MKKYYPTYWSGCTPIHAVNNWSLVRKLVKACINGQADTIPTIYIDGDLNNGALLTGTHRAAANDIIMMLNDKNGTSIELIGYKSVSDLLTSEQMDEVASLNDDAQDLIDAMLED